MCCHRDDPPGQSVTVATQELVRLAEENPQGLNGLDPVKDLHIREIDLVEQFRSLKFMQDNFADFQCVNCPKFEEHVSYRVSCRVSEDKPPPYCISCWL